MSGPKSTRYTLTPEQRRLLEEQRRLERQKAECLAALASFRERAKRAELSFPEAMTAARELSERTEQDNPVEPLIRELTLLRDCVLAETDGLEALGAQALLDRSTRVREMVLRMNTVTDEIQTQFLDDLESLNAIYDQDLRRLITQSGDFTNPFTQEKRNLRRQLEAMLLQRHKLSAELAQRLEKAVLSCDSIDDAVFFRNFESLTALPLLQDAVGQIREYDEVREQFEASLAAYETLCASLGVTPENVRCSHGGLAFLQSEIKRLERIELEAAEQRYICQCVDEVMEEMGYEVLGHKDVQKKSGVRFTSDLYRYEDGTAVSVTYAQDGRITMEIGATDTIDRAPDARETDRLTRTMEAFCEDFSEMEKRLLRKGVVARDRIQLLPPDPAYAQIINLRDYGITSPETAPAKQKQAPGRNRSRYQEQ